MIQTLHQLDVLTKPKKSSEISLVNIDEARGIILFYWK